MLVEQRGTTASLGGDARRQHVQLATAQTGGGTIEA
jgi:hypothetical protein